MGSPYNRNDPPDFKHFGFSAYFGSEARRLAIQGIICKAAGFLSRLTEVEKYLMFQ